MRCLRDLVHALTSDNPCLADYYHVVTGLVGTNLGLASFTMFYVRSLPLSGTYLDTPYNMIVPAGRFILININIYLHSYGAQQMMKPEYSGYRPGFFP